MATLFQVIFNGVSYGSTLALISLGLTLVFGIMRIVNFAHGAMYMLGAYAAFYAVEKFHLPYALAVVVAGTAMGLLGALLAVTIFRRFEGKLLEGAIASIALALLITNLAVVWFSGVPQSLEGPVGDAVVAIGSVKIIGQRLIILVVSLALLAGVGLAIQRTSWGRALRSVQQDPFAARVQGISVNRTGIQALALGGCLAGIAGALVAPDQVLLPSMGDAPLLLAFVVIIVGGMGSVLGSFIASMGVGLMNSSVSTYWSPEASTWVCFALVLVVLIVRPRGLFGHA